MIVRNVNGFSFDLIDPLRRCNKEIVKALSEMDAPTVYWSDDRNDYWMFDFKVSGIWFEMPRLSGSEFARHQIDSVWPIIAH